MDNLKDHEYDPDFSEYNPVQAEVQEIKNKVENMHKKGFWASLADKLTMRFIVQTD